MDDLEARVDALELAVLALGVQEFGDLPGHEFRGNQWTHDVNVGKVDSAGASHHVMRTTEKEAHAAAKELSSTHGEARVISTGGKFGNQVRTTEYKNGEKFDQKNYRFGGIHGAEVVRGEKATKVNLRDFDYNGRANGLPHSDELRTGHPVQFERSMGYEKPGNQYGQWVMQHQDTGLRVSGAGKRTEVEAGIKEQYPKSGNWTWLP